MDNTMMDNGLMASNTDQECGEAKREIPIKANGDLVNLKAMEFIPG
jgi:hypothetical protein